jgi:hypothetical protein
VKFAPGTRDSITGKPYFYKSQCGNYTVGIPANEALQGGIYNAWAGERDKRGQRSFVSLGNYPSARLAKEACERHEKEHTVDQAA